MKAIDIRYNKDIVGGKISDRYKWILEESNNKSAEKIKDDLAINGHPSELNKKFKGDGSGHGDCRGNCRDCWQQKVNEERWNYKWI